MKGGKRLRSTALPSALGSWPRPAPGGLAAKGRTVYSIIAAGGPVGPESTCVTTRNDGAVNGKGEAQGAVTVRGLYKAYEPVPALRGIDLDLDWGQRLVVFGPNGAGKTTLLRVLATLVKPDAGTVRVAGYDCRRQPVEVRGSIGFLSHRTLLYDEMTPQENLRFYARLYDIPNREKRVDQVLREVGMGRWSERRVRTLSHGMQKRVALARVMLHRPRLLLLDEPETGLDQEALGLLGEMMRRALDEGAAVMVTTHRTEPGLEMADHVAVLVEGRMVLHTPRAQVDSPTLQELFARYGEGA